MKNAILVLFMLFSCNIYCQNSVLIKDLEFKDDGKAYYKGLPFTGNAVRYNDKKISDSYNYVKGIKEGTGYYIYGEKGEKIFCNYKNGEITSYKCYDAERKIVLSSENETLKKGLVRVYITVGIRGLENWTLYRDKKYFSETDTSGFVLEICKLYKYKDGAVEKKVLSNWVFENIFVEIMVDGFQTGWNYKYPRIDRKTSNFLLSMHRDKFYLTCKVITDKGSKITLFNVIYVK